MSEKRNNNYVPIIGVVTQMIVLMGLGFYGGNQLDEYVGNEKPIYTLLIGLTVMIASMFLSLRQINKIFDSNK